MGEVDTDDAANRIDIGAHTDSTLSSDSMFHMRASELYPKCTTVKDQVSVSVPFEPLCGEDVKFIGLVNGGIAALSNYRFFYHLFSKDICYIIPIGVIEQVEIKEPTVIQISCKDVQTFRCTFSTPESCVEWHKRLTNAIVVPKNLDELFAFAHYAWAGEDLGEELPLYLHDKTDTKADLALFRSEVERMNFDVTNEGPWRISVANRDFELCKTYPRYLLLPASVTDEELIEVAKFRSSRRLPITVWRHRTNGAAIARCSQPEIGWFGCRSPADEQLLQAQIDACSKSCPPELVKPDKKLLIIDARSYSTAVANRVRGGGVECPEYYPHCEIKFMNLANIHGVRKSFNALQALCALPADEAGWFTSLDGTKWLHYISGLLAAAVTVFSAVEENGQPVVVHCSDGWDRTPQIVSLAEILLDPFYRTVKGFQVLVEREWIAFGHKFSSRCGFTEDVNERSPVFLQWLDCIQNIHRQYPCAFEFSLSFLMKLAQHIYSNLFGTFVCNSISERRAQSVSERTFSVWKFLEQPEYRNHLYTPNGDQILIPAYNVRDLVLWRELYLGYSSGESFLSVASGLAKADESTSIFDGDIASDKGINGSAALKLGDMDMPDGAVSGWIGSGVVSFDSVDGDETDYASNQSSTDTLVSTDNLARNCDSYETMAAGTLADEDWEILDMEDGDQVSAKPSAAPDAEEIDIEQNYGDLASATPPAAPDAEEISVTIKDDIVDVAIAGTSSATDAKAVAVTIEREIVDLGSDVPSDALDAEIDAAIEQQLGDLASASSEAIDMELFSDWMDNLRDESDEPRGLEIDDLSYLMMDDRRALGIPQKAKTDDSANPAIRDCEQVYKFIDPIDGLNRVRDDIQDRLVRVTLEHKERELALEQELHQTRVALLTRPAAPAAPVLPPDVAGDDEQGSLCSTEVSWEALEEPVQTLWVPDHAVSHCTNCHNKFWLGRRKHHCRKCGQIFCADCSEYLVPLPDQKLFEPVRVCVSCRQQLEQVDKVVTVVNVS